ncbi:MAG: ABC transporter substrate-binding protein [Bacteroidota bacterium]
MKPNSLLFSFFLLALLLSCKVGSDQGNNGLYEMRDGQVIYSGDLSDAVSSHILADPSSLHPLNSELAVRYEILDMCFDRLMVFDIHTGNLIPQLAEAPPQVSEDGLTYRFKIREEAAWADGSPIVAEDVVFSTKLNLCPLVENQNLKPYLEYIKDIRADEADPKTLIVEMKGFYINNDYFGVYSYVFDARFYDPKGLIQAYTVAELQDPKSKAMEDEALIAWAEEFNGQAYGRSVDHLISGSGPYVMTEWIPEQRIVLSRNEGYWGKNGTEYWQKQKPDQIIYKIVREDNSAVLQFREELLDVSTYLQPATYLNLQADSTVRMNYHMAIKPRTSFASLALNNRPDGISHQRFFEQAKVRKALALAINRERLVEEVLDGMGTICVSPVPPSNLHFHKNLQPFPYDIQQAETLLNEAGWEDRDQNGIREKTIDGKTVEFSFSFLHPPGSPVVERMAQFIQSELSRVGIECKPEPSADYAQKVQNKDYDATMLSLRASSLPYDFKQTFHSDNWPNGTNYFGYRNEEADRLMNELRAEQDEARRKEIANRIQEIIYEDQPVVFLFNSVKKVILHKRFTGGTIFDVPGYVQLNQLEVVRE